MEDVAISYSVHPFNIKNIFDALDIHSQTFQTIRDLNRDRFHVDTANLLEIGELRDLHTIQPDLPAQSPGSQSRRFPVILNKTDIVFFLPDAQLRQALQIQLLDIIRRRLDNDLILMMLE